MSAPSWWPPNVGDKLRGVWGDDALRDPLMHVVSVFEHAGKTMIVTAEWASGRWVYDVNRDTAAIVGLVRPDGAPRVGGSGGQ